METARAKMEKYGSIDYYSKKVVDFIDAQTTVFSASPDTLNHRLPIERKAEA